MLSYVLATLLLATNIFALTEEPQTTTETSIGVSSTSDPCIQALKECDGEHCSDEENTTCEDDCDEVNGHSPCSDSEDPKVCMTVNYNDSDTGQILIRKPCKFPFSYNGVEYNSCTRFGLPVNETRRWCATSTNETGVLTESGFCGPNCPFEDERVCLTSYEYQGGLYHGGPCIFPFNIHRGHEHHKCTTVNLSVNETRSWCATSTNETGVTTSYGFCGPKCSTEEKTTCVTKWPYSKYSYGGYDYEERMREPCVFPFKYKGVTYNACTKVDLNLTEASWGPWCSTLVDADGIHLGRGAFCGPGCPTQKEVKRGTLEYYVSWGVDKLAEVWVGSLAVFVGLLVLHLTILLIYFVATSRKNEKHQIVAIHLKTLAAQKEALPDDWEAVNNELIRMKSSNRPGNDGCRKIYKEHLDANHGDVHATNMKIFKNLGTGKGAAYLFSHVDNDLFSKWEAFSKTYLWWCSWCCHISVIAWLTGCLKMMAKSTFHYVDIIKDVRFALLLSQLPSAGVALGFAVASLVVAEVAKMVQMFTWLENDTVQNDWISPWIVMFSPVVPAILHQMEFRLRYQLHKLLANPEGTSIWQQALVKTRRVLDMTLTLNAELRATENVLEHLPQVLISIILLRLKDFSDTLGKFQRAFSLVSLFISSISIVRGQVHLIVAKKIGQIGVVAKLIIFLYICLSIFTRVLLISDFVETVHVARNLNYGTGRPLFEFNVGYYPNSKERRAKRQTDTDPYQGYAGFYFAETFYSISSFTSVADNGLFLFDHVPSKINLSFPEKEVGKWTYNISASGSTWSVRASRQTPKFLHNLEPLLAVILALHVMASYKVLARLQLSRSKIFLHALWSLLVPPLYSEWDEQYRRSNYRLSISECWSKTKFVIVTQNLITFLGNLMLSIPAIVYLSDPDLIPTSLVQTVESLEIDTFPLDQLTLSLKIYRVIPLLQLILVFVSPLIMMSLTFVYYKKFHPWSRVLNIEVSREGYLDKILEIRSMLMPN